MSLDKKKWWNGDEGMTELAGWYACDVRRPKYVLPLLWLQRATSRATRNLSALERGHRVLSALGRGGAGYLHWGGAGRAC